MKEQLVESTSRIYDGINACTSITVHETAKLNVGANAQAHANLQSNEAVRQASWHIQVDDTEAIRSFPDTAQCWHAGTDEGNKTSIAIEICVNVDGDYEKAFKNAAKVARDLRAEHGLGREAVVRHEHWSGKKCPAKIIADDRWEEFLALTDPVKETVPVATPPGGGTVMGKMVSPFEGRPTQNHGDAGGYAGHRGFDIAPPKPGQTGRPVYSAFDMTIRKLWRAARPGSRGSTWAPGRTGNGLLGSNPDGEGNGYNHMYPLASLRVGQKIRAGQLIGYNDSSGNQTGEHLHFELWSDWEDPYSDYDPMLAFDKFGIKPGSKPVIEVEPVAVKKPGTKPVVKPVFKMSKAETLDLQAYLITTGDYDGWEDGVYGPMLKESVKKFQRRQNQYGDFELVVDGEWGPKMKAHVKWVEELQRATRQWSASKRLGFLPDDGDYGKRSYTHVKSVMSVNGSPGEAYWKAGGRQADGVPGPVYCKMLGIRRHP